MYLIPLIFLQATFIYGGEEELGWERSYAAFIRATIEFSDIRHYYRHSVGGFGIYRFGL